MNDMTPQDVIILEVIKTVREWNESIDTNLPDGMSVDQYYDKLIDDGFEGDLSDAMDEFRTSGEPTSLPCDYSRNYESEQVARSLDGGAVSWTHWFGGGKHGEPSAMEWVSDAYFVEVEQKTVTVNVYTKKKD